MYLREETGSEYDTVVLRNPGAKTPLFLEARVGDLAVEAFVALQGSLGLRGERGA